MADHPDTFTVGEGYEGHYYVIDARTEWVVSHKMTSRDTAQRLADLLNRSEHRYRELTDGA